jgi:transketolase
MRTAFIQELIAQARLHPEIFLVVGDLGYSVVEPFADEFPDRFLNAGVAEQNMTGVAAGLASEGFHVFTYSIGNFPTLRCLEQIRNDVCYHNLPVTVVAVGAGMAYGNLGYSHHCIQDIACLRGMPNLTLLSPSDPGETRACVKWLVDNPRPSYLRIGKAGEPDLHTLQVSLASPLKIHDRSSKVAIVATGAVLACAISASNVLANEGFPCDVYSFIRLAPLFDADFDNLSQYDVIMAVEEHVQPGGLGELLAGRVGSSVRVISRSVGAELRTRVGSQSFLQGIAGVDSAGIANAIRQIVVGAK